MLYEEVGGADRLRRRSCLTIEAGLARRRLFNSHSNSAGRRRRSAASGLTGLDRGDVEKSDQIEAGSRLVSLDVEGKAGCQPFGERQRPHHSTVTLLARFLGLSTSVPRAQAV